MKSWKMSFISFLCLYSFRASITRLKVEHWVSSLISNKSISSFHWMHRSCWTMLRCFVVASQIYCFSKDDVSANWCIKILTKLLTSSRLSVSLKKKKLASSFLWLWKIWVTVQVMVDFSVLAISFSQSLSIELNTLTVRCVIHLPPRAFSSIPCCSKTVMQVWPNWPAMPDVQKGQGGHTTVPDSLWRNRPCWLYSTCVQMQIPSVY